MRNKTLILVKCQASFVCLYIFGTLKIEILLLLPKMKQFLFFCFIWIFLNQINSNKWKLISTNLFNFLHFVKITGTLWKNLLHSRQSQRFNSITSQGHTLPSLNQFLNDLLSDLLWLGLKGPPLCSFKITRLIR